MKLKGKNIAILGFGMEGRDVASYLKKRGIDFTICDIKNRKDLDVKGFEEAKFICGDKYLRELNKFDVIFRSPGIYRYKKEIIEAENTGSFITSATNLFFEECRGKIIGITGTKGKGTTANLIYKSFENDKKNAYLLGNIGLPILEKLEKIKNDTWVVLELSSFQLIDLELSPHVAVVLNITQDHLDWHKDIDEYVDSKKNIVIHQTSNDYAIISYDYATSRSFSKLGKGKKYYFSRNRKVKGSFIENGRIFLNTLSKPKAIAETEELSLRGTHIEENVTAAVCASYLAGVSNSSIKKAIVDYKGYEHRMEFVEKIEGVEFYNDSAATGPHSTMAAVTSFDRPITLILGGFDKGINYDQFAKDLAQNENVKNILLIGDISKKLEILLKQSKYNGKLLNLGESPMKVIVKKAKEAAGSNGIVLLSPAASSFDMFKNYKDRGDQFKKAVKDLNK